MQANQSTELLFELSHAGRRCHRLPACDVPIGDAKTLLPARAIADAAPPLNRPCSGRSHHNKERQPACISPC